jgi:hypothetical protein
MRVSQALILLLLAGSLANSQAQPTRGTPHFGAGTIIDGGIYNSADLTGVVVAAASALYPGLNVNKDQVRIDVGGLPQAWEFPNINQAGNYTTAAIAGSVMIPAGAYTGPTYSWPDFGVMAHALTYNPAKNAVALFGYAGVGVAGAGAEALNGVVTNCELSKPSCADGGGYNFAQMTGARFSSASRLTRRRVAW